MYVDLSPNLEATWPTKIGPENLTLGYVNNWHRASRQGHGNKKGIITNQLDWRYGQSSQPFNSTNLKFYNILPRPRKVEVVKHNYIFNIEDSCKT